jgi:3-oxoacyl-[acyl-carrier-protein] synthase-3
VEPGTPTSALAAAAAREALRRRGLSATDIELIIVATVTPDMPIPATACIVQEEIGAAHAWAFDISAACSGFLYGLTVAAQFIASGAHRRILVIGADVMSSIVAPHDRSTRVLFGDGAGAALLEPSRDDTGIIDFHHQADGSGAAALCIPAGGSMCPASRETVAAGLHHVRQDGPHVFKFAVRKLVEVAEALLARNCLSVDDLDLFVPHQGNLRIIETVAEHLGVDDGRLVTNLQRYGNTAASSIPLALMTAFSQGRLSRGHLVLLASVGAGYTAGAVLMRWAMPRVAVA